MHCPCVRNKGIYLKFLQLNQSSLRVNFFLNATDCVHRHANQISSRLLKSVIDYNYFQFMKEDYGYTFVLQVELRLYRDYECTFSV